MRLTSDGLTYALEIPAKPRLNRKEETRYLGIELPILRGLLLGDLPCPLSGKDAESVEVSGATIRLSSGPWIWVYSRTSRGGEKVPFQVELLPAEGEWLRSFSRSKSGIPGAPLHQRRNSPRRKGNSSGSGEAGLYKLFLFI